MTYTVVVAAGTRPEVIKMAPVIRELERRTDVFAPMFVTTAQQRELVKQAITCFDLHPTVDLDLMTPDQSLTAFAARAVEAVAELLDQVKPDAVLVQGDTTSAFATALAAFYRGVLIGHVEAGLRSYERRNPFPEEINRRMIGTLADLHFAPTPSAGDNLVNEVVDPDAVFVTGNTVVDALRSFPSHTPFTDVRLEALCSGKRVVLVTMHRRETFGEPLRNVCDALREVARRFDDARIVFPLHPNPNVRAVVREMLADVPGISLIDPVGYADFIRLMARSYLILTDSGGIQEEAPSLGKPVLVLRDTTERPELLESGGGKLVGTDTATIVSEVARLLSDARAHRRMATVLNPFGDGHAAERIVDELERALTREDRGADEAMRSAAAS